MIDEDRTEEEKALNDEHAKVIAKLKKAYQRIFSTDDGKLVLADLQEETFQNDTTFHPEQSIHAMQEGGRIIGIHIENMIADDKPENEEK